MENREILIAIENIIFSFVQNQFEANGVTPVEARLIMESLDGRFQKICLDSIIMGRVKISDDSNSQAAPEKENTEEAGGDRTKDEKAVSEMLKAASKPLASKREADNAASGDKLPTIKEG